MWTPATAVLWESWRLSRRRLAVLMFTGAVGGAALIVSPLDGGWGATLTLVLVTILATFGQSWAHHLDSRAGFTMRLGFTRPIRTGVLVGVPMAYIAVTCATTYLVPMIFLRAVFGIPFPLFPMAVLVSTVSLVFLTQSWWTSDSARRRVALGTLWLLVASWYLGTRTTGDRLHSSLAPYRWSEIFSFSTALYGWMAFISATAIGVAIVGVARQRCGEDDFAPAQSVTEREDARVRPTFTGWIADRLGVQCPVTSPMRAQLWFEMNTVGGRVLATGLLISLAAPLLLTIVSVSGVQGETLMGLAIWAPVVPLMAALPSMLGVRRKQGNTDLTAFAATRPLGTARLAGLRILVASLTLLIAWGAIWASIWVFGVRLAAWGPENQAVFIGYLPTLPASADALTTLVSVVAYTTATVAGAGALHALVILDGRRVALVGLGLVLYIVLWVVAGMRGWVGGDTIRIAQLCIVTSTILLGTAYLLRRLIAERIFTPPGLLIVLGIWAGFAVMSLWFNPDPNDGLDSHVAFFVIALLPLTAAALAPWSFNRLRHR